MSFDLGFWKPTTSAGHSPSDVYQSLCEEEPIEGLDLLSVVEIKTRFREAFPEITDDGTELMWEGAESYFQVTWPPTETPHHTSALFITCGWDLVKHEKIINRIYSVGHTLGCGVYDPQSDVWSTKAETTKSKGLFGWLRSRFSER